MKKSLLSTLAILMCFTFIGCEVDTRPNPNHSTMSGNKALTLEDTKGDEYWSDLSDYTGFNDIQINSIRMIILETERKKKNLPLINGVPDKTQIQEINKDKITQLVHLLGDFREYRKVNEFERNQILKKKEERLEKKEKREERIQRKEKKKAKKLKKENDEEVSSGN